MKQGILAGLAWICVLVGTRAQDTDSYISLTGKIQDFNGGNVFLVTFPNNVQRLDTIAANDDGTFCIEAPVRQASVAYLTFEEKRSSLILFAEPGMRADLQIRFHTESYMGENLTVANAVYSGDCKDASIYLKKFDDWKRSAWPFERMDSLSFPRFRELLLQDVDRLKAEAYQINSEALRTMVLGEINAKQTDWVMRYAWCQNNADSHFVTWINSFDRNSPDNLQFAVDYMRWHIRAYPLKRIDGIASSYLERLKQVFSNQEVIDALATDYMRNILQSAPENMIEVWEAYKHLVSNKENVAKLQPMYEVYARMMPGVPSIDFEMTDKEGKICHLSDFRGRALYIDVWATWCGPCCMEIPFVEKLVEHYKDNSNIEFLSISLDRDKKAWEKKLEHDKPAWKQFICQDNFESTLAKSYEIKGIPRFLFFDKEGKIISLKAPRPSFEGIIEYIDSHLCEN